MRLDGRHIRSDKLIQYYLSLSMLRGEILIISYPTPEILELVRLVASFAKANVKGAGIASIECVFMPSKIVKKQELTLDGYSAVPLLQTLLLPFIFCGHQVTITLKNTLQKDLSTYYIRDVLLPYFYRYVHISTFEKIPNGDIRLIIKGKYLLEEAPPFILRKNTYLVALRGEVESSDDKVADYVDLSLKELGVPVRIHRIFSQDQEILHLNALYGTDEGYDNDFAYIIYKDLIDENDILGHANIFKQELKNPRLSAELIEDLLLFVGLLGGQLPFAYDETDMLVEELNKELVGSLERIGDIYVLSAPEQVDVE